MQSLLLTKHTNFAPAYPNPNYSLVILREAAGLRFGPVKLQLTLKYKLSAMLKQVQNNSSYLYFDLLHLKVLFPRIYRRCYRFVRAGREATD